MLFVLDAGTRLYSFSPIVIFKCYLPRFSISSLEKLHLFSAHVSDDIHVLFQHRMRPEIARLLTPHIYQDLENHPSVLKYEKIKVSLPYRPAAADLLLSAA